MNQTSNSQSDIKTLNERLGQTFYSSRRYNPVLLGVTGIGFIAIFLFTRYGILGESAPQLLYIGILTLLYAVAELPALALAQQNKGIAANLYGTVVGGLFAVIVTSWWQGITVITILVAAVTPVLAFRAGMPRKYVPTLLLLLVAAIGAILYIERNTVDRLQNSNSAAIASIVFFLSTTLLLLTITIVSQNRRFKSLQSLLLASFVMIVTIPTVMTAILSAVGAYANSQAQTLNTLQTITTLKRNQIEALLADSQDDTQRLLADPRFASNTVVVLTVGELNAPMKESFKRTARLRMGYILGAEEEVYSEIMVLDMQGNIIISSIPSNEGRSFEKRPFLESVLNGNFTGFVDEPSFGTENLLITAPVIDASSKEACGVLVLRSNAAAIKQIMENTPGFSEAETYLVNTHFRAASVFKAWPDFDLAAPAVVFMATIPIPALAA